MDAAGQFWYVPCNCTRVGHGITSSVFLAMHQETSETSRFCVAKEITEPMAYLGEKEAKFLQNLQHENVVNYLYFQKSVGRNRTVLYMDRCDGNLTTLMQEPDNRLGINPSLFLSLLAQLASGFGCLSQSGVFHRDIKPANILYQINPRPVVNEFGRKDFYTFKLADFGVARQISEDQMASTLVGTPEFLHYHVALGKYGIYTDLWSIAVTLYYMLTGHLSFKWPSYNSHQKEFFRTLGLLTTATPALACPTCSLSIKRSDDFRAHFAAYLKQLHDSRPNDGLSAAYVLDESNGQMNFQWESGLPAYCQLNGRLKREIEDLLSFLLSAGSGTESPSNTLDVPDCSSLAPPRQVSIESARFNRMSEFVERALRITDECWFHCFDISSSRLVVVHGTPQVFDAKNGVDETFMLDKISQAILKSPKSLARTPLKPPASTLDMEATLHPQILLEARANNGPSTVTEAIRLAFKSGQLTDQSSMLIMCLTRSPSGLDVKTKLAAQLACLSKEFMGPGFSLIEMQGIEFLLTKWLQTARQVMNFLTSYGLGLESKATLLQQLGSNGSGITGALSQSQSSLSALGSVIQEIVDSLDYVRVTSERLQASSWNPTKHCLPSEANHVAPRLRPFFDRMSLVNETDFKTMRSCHSDGVARTINCVDKFFGLAATNCADSLRNLSAVLEQNVQQQLLMVRTPVKGQECQRELKKFIGKVDELLHTVDEQVRRKDQSE